MLSAIAKPYLTLGPPESVGVSSQRIVRVESYVRQAVDAGVIPLADVAIVRRGTLVGRASFVNPELAARGYRLDADSLYYLGSYTKVFVATLILQQVERGRVMLSRPVAELIEEICDQPLVFPPGTRGSYCTWGFVLLAEILRLVTGRSLEELGRAELFEPLGMVNTAFGCPADQLERVVPAFDADLELHPVMNDPAVLTMMRGDTGAYSTADDLAAFGQMMLNGGALGSARVLSPVTVRHTVESQYPWGDSPERLAGTGEDHFVTLSKGLGWMVRGAGFFRGSDLMSRRAFFHGGYLGMRVIVDPAYDLVSVFLTSIAATKPTRNPWIGMVGHVSHTFGTMACAAIAEL